MLTSPLRDRFGIINRLELYNNEQLTAIVKRSAGILKIEITEKGAAEVASRSRGTPRIANRLFKRVRDFALVMGDGYIGLDIANRYREKPEIIDAIGSHHGDKEPTTLIAPLVAAADTLSAARPGARSESLDSYIKRLTQLEEICNGFKGVEKAYALQAGREIRVLVKPEEITDVEAYKVARDMRVKIENDVQYPGTIKVVVIRELRVNEVAK